MKAPLPLEDKTHAALAPFHETLARLRAWGRPLRSVGDAAAEGAAQAVTVLRHDVRRNLKSALTMAQWEHAAGVHGTFFLRPVGVAGEESSYYGRLVDGRVVPSPQMLDDARAIAALGHEIGLLGPFDDAAARLGVAAADFVRAQVALLREAGIEVRGIVDGGTALAADAAGVAFAAEQLRVDEAWDESRLADAGAATPVAARLLVRFESDAWSRVAGKPRKADVAAPTATPAPVLTGAADTPFAVALRGDAIGRRMLLAPGRSVFPKGLNFVLAEATSCRSLAHEMQGRHPDEELAAALVRLDAMPVLLRDAFLAQFSRGILQAGALDLLVIDTEVEFERDFWRHREDGWSAWFPARFVRGIEPLEALFEPAPPPDAQTLGDAILALVRQLRETRPALPAVVLCKQSGARVPPELARQLADVFRDAGDAGLHVLAVPASDDPARDLLQAAWDAGLHRHFPQAPAPVVDATSAAPATPAVAEASAAVPLVRISYQRDTATCGAGCAQSIDSTAASLATYFLSPDDPLDAPRRYTPSLLPMAEAWDFDAWEKAIKPLSGGNRLREKRKAIELGYTVRPFEYAQYVPDIHEINHSKEVRSGGPMRGSYQRSVEEMGGAPTCLHPVRMPTCPHHWGLMFGVFRPAPGRTQGEVVVDDQLVGYISLRRVGGVALYSQILGHGDYLQDFVLVLLHHEIIRWLSGEREGLARDLEYVMYGGAESGGESLLQWKRRAGFRPMRVVATGAQTAAAV